MRDDDGSDDDGLPPPGGGDAGPGPAGGSGPESDRPDFDRPDFDLPDFDLPDDELTALSAAVDDAFDETFGGAEPPDDASDAPETPADDDAHPDDDGLEPAVARAAMLTDRENETLDLEDADDDDSLVPSRPDSLVGAIPWDDAGRGPPRIAFAGGHGGVGRTLLAANAALVLARLGRRCTVVDLDPVGAGLHTALGLPPLLPALADAIDPPPPRAPEPVAGVPLRLLRPGRPTLTGPADPLRAECLAAAATLGDEALLLDLGPMADPFTLDAWLAADVGVVVAEPLPAAIERAYGFIRAALWRRMLHGDDPPTRAARDALAADPGLDSPPALLDALGRDDPAAARALRARVMTFTPRLVLNRTRSRIDREMGPAMVSALRRRWGVSAEFVGAIDDDDAVRDAARRRRPLLLAYPGAAFSQAVSKVALRLHGVAEGRA